MLCFMAMVLRLLTPLVWTTSHLWPNWLSQPCILTFFHITPNKRVFSTLFIFMLKIFSMWSWTYSTWNWRLYYMSVFHVEKQDECLFLSIYFKVYISLCRHSIPVMILFWTQSCADWAWEVCNESVCTCIEQSDPAHSEGAAIRRANL